MSQIRLEYVSCPNCSVDKGSIWGTESGFNLLKCGGCGLLYVNPRPSGESISEANKVGIHQTEEGKLNVRARRSAAKVPHYSKLIRLMFGAEIAAAKPIRWLDVGAGYGEVIEAVAATMPDGSEAIGIEPMKPKADAAKALGLAVDCRTLEEVGGNYDVISLINVFSHIPDFKEFARSLVSKLRPGGILFLETGNVAELRERSEFPDILYLPDHLVFTGVEQMRQMLTDIGLTLVDFRREPIDDALWSLKQFVKGILAGKLVVRPPGSSAFRTVFYKAKLEV